MFLIERCFADYNDLCKCFCSYFFSAFSTIFAYLFILLMDLGSSFKSFTVFSLLRLILVGKHVTGAEMR